jgi:Acetyl-CoA dehydrogenase C-terminal like
VIRDKAAVLGELLTQIEKAAQPLTSAPASARPLTNLRSGLLDCCARLRAATTELIANSAHEPDLVGATAYHFLQWLGLLTGGWQLALAATRAAAEPNTGAARATADMAAFYAAHILPRTLAHEATVRTGAAPVATASAADL